MSSQYDRHSFSPRQPPGPVGGKFFAFSTEAWSAKPCFLANSRHWSLCDKSSQYALQADLSTQLSSSGIGNSISNMEEADAENQSVKNKSPKNEIKKSFLIKITNKDLKNKALI